MGAIEVPRLPLCWTSRSHALALSRFLSCTHSRASTSPHRRIAPCAARVCSEPRQAFPILRAMALLSPRSSVAGSSAWPPAAVVTACPAGLLSLHRDLLRLCAPLERALADGWEAQLDTLARIVASIESTRPRWTKLIDAQAAANRRQRATEAEELQQRAHQRKQAEAASTVAATSGVAADSVAATADDDADAAADALFYSEALPLPPSSSDNSSGGGGGGGGGEDPDERALAHVGVLTMLPAHVAKLALHQQTQMEIAVNLLTNTQSATTPPPQQQQHEMDEVALRTSSFETALLCCAVLIHSVFLLSHELALIFHQLSAAFDGIHEVYSQHKKLYSPTQLSMWCSVASAGGGAVAIGSAGAAAGAAAGSGHKKSAAAPASDKRGKDKSKSGGAGGKDKSGGGSAGKVRAEEDDPPANSVTNIMRAVEAIENIINAQSDIKHAHSTSASASAAHSRTDRDRMSGPPNVCDLNLCSVARFRSCAQVRPALRRVVSAAACSGVGRVAH